MPAPFSVVQKILATLALLAGGLLASIGVQRATRIDNVNAPVTAEWITKPAELDPLRAAAVGRYVTGGEPGDRGIEISPAGQVRFFRVLEKGERSEPAVASRLGRINGRLNFVTARHGAVEVINIDTLSYYRDVYRRAR